MENYAGNIISNLAGLPEFLRKPMLRSRMANFSGLTDAEKIEVIDDALSASSTVPFDLFANLFGTWLQVLAEMDVQSRRVILEYYIRHLAEYPENVIGLHVDGLTGIFVGLSEEYQNVIIISVRDIVNGIGPEQKRRVLLLVPSVIKDKLEA